MKKYLLVKFLLFLPLYSFGQEDSDRAYLQSLLDKPASYTRDSLLILGIRAYWAKADAHEDNEYISFFLKKLPPVAADSKWPPAMANYYYLQGSEYLRNNQLYAAFDYLEKAIREFRALKDEDNFRRVNNKFIPLMNWNIIENKIPERAKEKYASYISEAVKGAEAGNDTGIIANLKITQASYMLFVLSDYPKSLQLIDEILELLKGKDKEKWFSYYHITLLGQCLNYLNLGEARKAEKLLEEIIKSCQQRQDSQQAKYILGQVSGFVGRYYLNKKDYKKALKYASLAEGRTDFMRFPYFVNYLHETLYGAYKYNGRAAEALKYLERVRSYEQEAEAERLNHGFAEWQLKYETEKHKNQINRLENENLMKSEQQNRTIRNALLMIMAIVGVAGVFIMKSNRKLKQKNEELKQKNEEITQAVFKGQTIERKRVASELHDNLNTKIAALKWRVESAEKPTPEDLKIFVQILDDIYADVRLIANNLIPSDLETAGFVFTVRKLINSLVNHPIQFHFSEQGLVGRLPIEIEYQLYNIILELINNILKHSQATQAWITLTFQEDYIILRVSDNGVGLSVNRVKMGAGIANIRSRVDQLKGRFNMSYPSEEGASIEITLPVS